MLLRRLLFGFGACLLGVSCSAEGPANVDEAVQLAQLRIGDVRHEFGIFPNQQGLDSPCVGVTVTGEDRTTVSMACPAEPTEDDEYAAVLELDTASFVVGYGLQEGETIRTEHATSIDVVKDPDGHRLFVIRLRRPPDPGPIELTITTVDGGVRTISTDGTPTP